VSELPPPPAPVPPPPPAASPIPPPPPPTLTAPPGYAGYTAAPINTVPLKRITGTARATIVLVTIASLMSVLQLFVRQSVVDEADDFIAGATTERQFVESITTYWLVQTLALVVTVAAGVLAIIWMFAIAKNHRTLHRDATWGPGWAIWGWFLPPMVIYIIPALMLRELWKASDPDVPVGGRWRSNPGTWLTWLWWALYGIAPVVILALQFGSFDDQLAPSEHAMAEQITTGTDLVIASTVVSVAAGAVFVLLVRDITSRHRRLTGETRG
jgi:hypothetical protein